ncbi:amidase [Streptomyces sp. NPDC051909]|uniref:amidase n=1 Tax=Streptomyces sp. NPDC051909 TaxID=3154944 RepID=UPI00343D5CF8
MAEHLDHIRVKDPEVGAFRRVLEAEALRDAQALECRTHLRALPLAGVPVAVKDNLAVKGVPIRHGSAATREVQAKDDHVVVRRLRAAGAIVIGVTAVPELCVFKTTDGMFGIPRNPWLPARSAGGSSGGSAAAVAAGMVPIALGSDGMGSIRIPAASCGVVGLKPGRGVVPSGLGVNDWFGMAENGPIASCVDDIRLLLAVIANEGTRPDHAEPVGRLRIALSVRTPLPRLPVADQLAATVWQSGRLLTAGGHHVVHDELPYPPWLGSAALSRWTAGAAADARGLNFRLLTRRTRTHVMLGRAVTSARFVRRNQQLLWQQRLEKFFTRCDVLVTPALAQPVPVAKAWHTAGWPANVLANMRFAPFSYPWNLAGWPAMAVPLGSFPSTGISLPRSVQVIAPPGGEERLLQLASQLERDCPWPRMPMEPFPSSL